MNPIKAFLKLIYFIFISIFINPFIRVTVKFFSLLIDLFYAVFMNSYMLKIYKILGIYICYIVCHYLASHLYTEFCVPQTFIGLVQSPFTAVLPHCQALRWIIYNGGNTISLMWTALGAWLILKVGNYLTKVNSEEI